MAFLWLCFSQTSFSQLLTLTHHYSSIILLAGRASGERLAAAGRKNILIPRGNKGSAGSEKAILRLLAPLLAFY